MIKLNNHSFNFAIFDFDGVIVDSTAIKTEVFRKTIAHYPISAIEEFITYHKLHGGVSRWEKFEHFLNEIVKIPKENIPSTLDELVKNFSNLLNESFNSITLTTGACEILDILKSSGTTCYIISGAAQEEVIHLCKKNQVDYYFTEILGSPKNKFENLTYLKEKGALNGDGFFIGDALTDFTSANQFNLSFVFMSNFTEWVGWENEKKHFFLYIKNLEELKTLCKSQEK